MPKIYKQKRCLLVQVVSPHFHRDTALEAMEETQLLVDTLGGVVVEKLVQHRFKPDNATYVGKGKLEELAKIVKEKKVEVLILNDLVKSGQLFRVEKSLWEVNPQIQVWDRVGLILQIFEKHASSAESKLQIELARITHDGPRIYGLGKDRLSRQGGGIGSRGLGETNIEREKRVIKLRQQQIRKKLKKLFKQKKSVIQSRQAQGVGPVALVGYTSAGKTTLFNQLTGKNKMTNRGLFTTLDTVVGKMKTHHYDLPVLISDTIGFIRDLPPMLVDAFRSTLMESVQAELLLHIIDAGDPQLEEKVDEVEEVLRGLRVTSPVMLVFNKIDTVDKNKVEFLGRTYFDFPHVFVSAKTGKGLDHLKDEIVLQIND